MSDVSIRLKRLFNNGRCFDVAVDHGFFGEGTFLAGIEDMKSAVDTLIDAAPDAIQLTLGQAKLLQSHTNPHKPALVLRTVVVNLLDLPGRPELRDSCIRNIMTLKAQCEHYGMPLMVEPLVMKDSSVGGYTSDGELEKVLPLVRQAIELGADVIKADPTDNAADYHHVIQTAGNIPVLVRGGGRVSDEELLNRTAEVLKQGAAGIVYGRNIIAHPKPAKMTAALMSMLHEGTSAPDALKIVNA
jgi:fructose-bisphosphate aldolase, class I